MDWILDHFQFVALIAVVIGSLAKRFLEAKASERQAGDETPDDGDIFGPGEDWEPPQANPQPSVPPPIVRQSAPPAMRQATPPPLRVEESEASAALKRQQDMQDRLRQIKETKATITGGAAATSARVSAAQSRAKPCQPAKAGLRGVLRNRKEIRRAIVMREILGPPLGLR